MNCDDIRQQIPLLLYEEIDENGRQLVQAHMRECSGCQDVYNEHRHMHAILAEEDSAWDVPADLLSEARRGLSQELEAIAFRQPWWKKFLPAPMKALEYAALMAAGLALGVFIQSQRVPVGSVMETAGALKTPSPENRVANVRIVNADPATGMVELTGDRIEPMQYRGRMDDEIVRDMLFSALQDAENAGFRLSAVELLARNPQDEAVKAALIHALMNDGNPAVRGRALQGLKSFAGEPAVQAALMHALGNDNNPGIRVEAIDALTSVTGNAGLAKSLEEMTQDDDNQYVRMKALQFVGNPK